jgi:hypothetical protein
MRPQILCLDRLPRNHMRSAFAALPARVFPAMQTKKFILNSQDSGFEDGQTYEHAPLFSVNQLWPEECNRLVSPG